MKSFSEESSANCIRIVFIGHFFMTITPDSPGWLFQFFVALEMGWDSGFQFSDACRRRWVGKNWHIFDAIIDGQPLKTHWRRASKILFCKL